MFIIASAGRGSGSLGREESRVVLRVVCVRVIKLILELEAEPARLVTSPPLTPIRLAPGAAMATERSYVDRTRRPDPSRGPSIGR